MKVEGLLQKRVRQLRDERRDSKYWHGAISSLVEEARQALASAKTKKEMNDVVKQYFGYEVESDVSG